MGEHYLAQLSLEYTSLMVLHIGVLIFTCKEFLEKGYERVLAGTVISQISRANNSHFDEYFSVIITHFYLRSKHEVN